jgi:hypothetical protein
MIQDGGMKDAELATIVNTAFLYANSIGSKAVILGQSRKSSIYDDTGYVKNANTYYSRAYMNEITMINPLSLMTKTEVVVTGVVLSVPYGRFVTCDAPTFKNREWLPCGRCETCIDRMEAFHNTTIADQLDRKYIDTAHIDELLEKDDYKDSSVTEKSKEDYIRYISSKLMHHPL